MMIHQGRRSGVVLKTFLIGAHPIIQACIQRLKIPEIIATYVKHDRRFKPPVERMLRVLVPNILTARTPIYEIADWLARLDESSLGIDREETASIHDDRMGKALQAFQQGRHKDASFRLALSSIEVFELDCSRIHQDTTTVTLYVERYEVVDGDRVSVFPARLNPVQRQPVDLPEVPESLYRQEPSTSAAQPRRPAKTPKHHSPPTERGI
ncbi:MAG TPA: DUF4277 domain-containing protein [Planctomycetaceae bacterium]|nr:DUF4277 domain-containing protein [Planctomycetaceae bacterium]